MAETFVVTGGTGRIGTAFVHEMAARGATVRLGTATVHTACPPQVAVADA